MPAQMETKERERTGIKSLKIKYNRVFGYALEVTNTFKELVPGTTSVNRLLQMQNVILPRS